MTWPINYQSPLMLEGWLEFNRCKWGVVPLKIRLNEGKSELPAIEAVLYLDKKGKIMQPPLNPYLPIAFYPTPTDKQTRIYGQWMRLSKILVEEFNQRGITGLVTFPPEVQDVRQWQWNGFLAEVRFTFYLKLPYDLSKNAEPNKIRMAQRAGFTCGIAERKEFKEIVECLEETERRKSFSHNITVEDLDVVADLLGENHLKIYLCRSKEGELATIHVVLVADNMALFWIAGTRTKFLGSGARQLVILYSLNDLAIQGISLCDFVGANLPDVSAGKADWGGELKPYYLVRPLNLRGIASLSRIIFKQWLEKKNDSR